MGRLFHLLATNLLGLYMDAQNRNSDEGRSVAATCYLTDLPGNDLVWLRSQFTTDEGMILGVIAEDFPMCLLLPEPPEGYEVHFAPNDDYRKLFAILSQEGCLELLLFLYHKKFSYYTPSALASCSGTGPWSWRTAPPRSTVSMTTTVWSPSSTSPGGSWRRATAGTTAGTYGSGPS